MSLSYELVLPCAQVIVEPQFSPLTPYQSADSLPPPVYGLLEERSDIDATLITPKLVDNLRNHYGSKQKKNGEILRSPSKKWLPTASSKNAQLKNWKVPPGAKLIGYNVQMIAGYIPTTYLNNSRHKTGKGRLESQDSETSLVTYSEYVPGYSMNTIKNYEVNQKSDKLNTVTARADSLENDTDDELLNDESIVHTNFNFGKSRFLGKREKSTTIDATSSTVGMVDLGDFLWPVIEAEPEAEKQDEESIFASKVDRNTTESNKGLSFIGPIERNLSVSQKNTSIRTTVKPYSRDTRGRLEDNPVAVFQSVVATSSAESTASVYDENLEKLQFMIPQKANSSMKNRYIDEVLENLTSNSEQPQLRGGAGKAGQEFPLFQQFSPAKLQMNYTDGQATLITKEPSEMTASRRSLPVITPKTTINIALIQQKNIDKNGPTVETIIRITEPSNECERESMDIKRLSEVHVISAGSAQNSTSNPVAMPQSTTMKIDISEFDDEDYDKAEQNRDGNSFPKLENPEFSEIEPINEQRREMNEKLDPGQDSGDVNGNDEHEESLQGAEFRESNGDDGDGRWLQGKPVEMKNSSEGISSRNKENFKDDYDDQDDGDDDDNHDDDVRDDDDDNPEMIKENDDEVLRLQENSEEKQGRIDASIFVPGQIPTFEEWLSSLPIQPAFPFGSKSGMWNQSPADPNHQSFFRPFRRGSKNEENRQEGQRLAADSKKKQRAGLYNYDHPEDKDKVQFQEQRFILPKNVPYK
ncbi:hypothetical protein LOAG_11641 [Loa loa]|uniref:Uncharacterized protein n=1 Tax=Loa loa TaxID=7209 RepID=A0A1S0TMM6_LOALO|nr:hypothetical protein LOAG_11641 [Loa loa]EFO16861.1 hypothetical protein LOAG_11641 [Loa loa]